MLTIESPMKNTVLHPCKRNKSKIAIDVSLGILTVNKVRNQLVAQF